MSSLPLENQIADMLKEAMRARDSRTADCLRMVKTRHMERRTASGFKGPLDDALWLDVIASYQKQLRKTREEYVAVGERGAATLPQLDFEIALCGRFLPQAASDEEVLGTVRDTIAKLGAPDLKQTGRIVGEIMKAHKGKYDPSTVKRLVEQELATPRAGS